MLELSDKCTKAINIKLGELLCHVANIATGIRMNSKYNPCSIDNTKTPEAVMWLSDALHNLDKLGSALGKRSPENIRLAIDSIIRNWEYNRENIDKASSENINSPIVNIDDSIELLRSIKELVSE